MRPKIVKLDPLKKPKPKVARVDQMRELQLQVEKLQVVAVDQERDILELRELLTTLLTRLAKRGL